MLQRIKQILKDQRGASFLEYIFLAVIILVAGIVTFKSIGKEVSSGGYRYFPGTTEARNYQGSRPGRLWHYRR